MIAKVAIISALVAVTLAQHYGYGAGPSYGGHQDDYYHQPQPYDFGYETNDDYGTTTFRKESGDGHGRVQGSYGYKDEHGIQRQVDYVADEHGFRADVKTNEPGTDNQNPADVHISADPVVVDAPYGHGHRAGYGHGGPGPVYGHSAPGPVYGHGGYGHGGYGHGRY